MIKWNINYCKSVERKSKIEEMEENSLGYMNKLYKNERYKI